MASSSTSMSALSQRIAHIADLHIGSSPGRSTEYRKVFDLFFESINDLNVDIVVIAGDIFHKKTTFTGSDVADFKYLLAGIPSNIQIIIIPGNHDTNLNDVLSVDLISPVLGPNVAPNIKWSKYTETFVINGLSFRHVSVFDNEPIIADTNHSILLYHGFIAGAVFGKYTVADKESRVTKSIGNSFRAVLAGDIHGMQIFGDKKTIAYPGSMIQQNIGESVDKGYLLWDIPLDSNISPPTFVVLPNDSAMVRLDFRGKTALQIQDLLEAIPVPNNILKVALFTDTENSADQQKMIVDKFGRVDKINYTAERLADGIVTEDEIENTLAGLLVNAGLDIDITEEIVLGYKSRMSIDNRRWYIRSLEFDNMFKYGQGNFIDFTKLEGISGVIADNRAGKSSIIDILVYTLFNKLLRGDKNSVINFAYKTARSKLTFVVEPDIYIIEKDIEKSTKPASVRLYKNGINITASSIIETYKIITTLVGNVDQFCMTGLFYNDTHNIVTLSPAERMKLLPAIIGIVDEQILADTKVKIKNLKQSLTGIPTGDPMANDKLTSATTLHETAVEDVDNAEQAFSVANEYSGLQYNDIDLYIQAIAETEAEVSSHVTSLASIVPPNTTPFSATPCELSSLEREALQFIIEAAPKTLPVIPPIPEPRGFKIENIADVITTAETALDETCPVPSVDSSELNNIANNITLLKSQLANSPVGPPNILINLTDLPVGVTVASLAEELLEVDKEIVIVNANISAVESQLSSVGDPEIPVSPEDKTSLLNILSKETQTLQNYEKQLIEANVYKDFEFLDPTRYTTLLSHTDEELASISDKLTSIVPPTKTSISATPCELSSLERETLQVIIDTGPITPPVVSPLPGPQGFKIENLNEVKILATEEPCIVWDCMGLVYTPQHLNDVEQKIHNLQSQICHDPKTPPSNLRYPNKSTIVDPTAIVASNEKQIAEIGIKVSIVEDMIASMVSPVLSTYQPETEKLISARSRLLEINIPFQVSAIKVASDKINLNKIEYAKKVANRQSSIQSLDDQIKDARSRSLYKFGFACDECTYNKTLLDKDLADLQKQKDILLQDVIPEYDETEEKLLVELQKELDKAVLDKSSIETLIKEIEDRMSEHNKSVENYKQYTEIIAGKKRELETFRQILIKLTNEHADILNQLECDRWYEAEERAGQLKQLLSDRDNILKYMENQTKKERNDQIMEARRKISQHELYCVYIDQMDKYHISQELQKKYNRVVEARAKITAADLYSDYKKTIAIKELIERQNALKEQQDKRRREYEELQKYTTIYDVQSVSIEVSLQRDKVASIHLDITDLEKRISEYNTAMDSYNKTMNIIATIGIKVKSLNQSLSALNIKRKVLLEQIDCAKWYEAVDKNIQYKQALADQSSILRRLEEYNSYKVAMEQNDLILEARRKVIQHELYESYISELNLYHSVQQSYKDYMTAIEAKSKIVAADTYSDYKKCIRINDIKNTINDLSRRLEQLRGELEKLNRALIYPIPCLQSAKTELMNAQNALGKATANKLTAETNVSIRQNWEQHGKPLDTQLRNLEEYKKCLANGSLRLAIVKRMLDKIVLSINRNLVEITDFNVEYMIEDDQIELFIKERGHKLPIELASGFQKFIISLMFRIAVTMNKCEFLIIDEGFGCLDETNMRAAIEFFNTIQHSYRFLFVISHVSEMHSALNTPLVIKKIGNNSYINNISDDNIIPVITESIQPVTTPHVAGSCGCGAIFAPSSKKAHEKTQKHQRWLNLQ